MSSTGHAESATITPGSWVLVTGVNGFIGSHVANELLIKGYNVRGTARDTHKVAWIQDIVEQKYGRDRFEPVIMLDLAAAGAFDKALKGVEGVVRIATDLSLNPNPNEVVPPTIAHTLNILTSAAKEPSIRRFVLTSTSMATCTPIPNKVFTVINESWSHETIKEAWAPPPYEQSRGLAVYGASKTEAEMKAWKFVREKKPRFVFNTVLPSTTFGPSLDFGSQFASSGGILRLLFQGNRAIELINPQYFNDVRDCAYIHVAALTVPEVKNERLFSWAETWNKNQLLTIFRKNYPDR